MSTDTLNTPSELAIEPPLQAAIDELAWAQEVDVLVVGFGAAGAAAALEAHSQGGQVLLVDRFGHGGATAKSGGVVYAGGGTPQQKAAGYDDTPEAMFNYLRHEVGDAVKPETLRRFCDESRDLLSWLEGLGAEYRSHPAPPKTSYPKNGVYLYYSGNEAIAGYCEDAKPAPRGHRTVDAGLSGKRLFQVVETAVERAGIPVCRMASVRRLVVDHSGQVIGAEVWELAEGSAERARCETLIRRADGVHNALPGLADRWRRQAMAIERSAAKPRLIRARGGVVLATGGFVFHRQMLAQYAPKYMPNMRLGTSACEGSGIRLGQSVGGAVDRMDKVSAWRFINPPTPWVTGVVVNQQGERFCNEGSYGARLGSKMCEEQGGRAWLVLDKAQRRAAWREALRGGLWIFQSGPAILLMLLAPRAKSLSALAQKLGIAADGLRRSVDEYNDAASGRKPDVLGKAETQLQPIVQPPFAAMDLSPSNPMFPCPAITLGGLKIDEDSGAVINAQGEVIRGLYAAGRAAVGIASNGYVSGLSLADCFWSGRRAGRSTVAEAKRQG